MLVLGLYYFYYIYEVKTMADYCAQTEIYDELELEIEDQIDEEFEDEALQISSQESMLLDEGYIEYLCEQRCISEYGEVFEDAGIRNRLYDYYIEHELIF